MENPSGLRDGQQSSRCRESFSETTSTWRGSRAKDTHYVESFNNALLIYHDKRICFGLESYLMRINLAVLDWNENVDRDHTSEWECEDATDPRRRENMKQLVEKKYIFRKNVWEEFMRRPVGIPIHDNSTTTLTTNPNDTPATNPYPKLLCARSGFALRDGHPHGGSHSHRPETRRHSCGPPISLLRTLRSDAPTPTGQQQARFIENVALDQHSAEDLKERMGALTGDDPEEMLLAAGLDSKAQDSMVWLAHANPYHWQDFGNVGTSATARARCMASHLFSEEELRTNNIAGDVEKGIGKLDTGDPDRGGLITSMSDVAFRTLLVNKQLDVEKSHPVKSRRGTTIVGKVENQDIWIFNDDEGLKTIVRDTYPSGDDQDWRMENQGNKPTTNVGVEYRVDLAGGQLDPDLGSYVHQLCDKYKKEHPASFKKAVEMIGKQPKDDVWVLNESVQLDADGKAIRPEDQKYAIIGDGKAIRPEDQKYAIIGGALKRHYLEVKDFEERYSYWGMKQQTNGKDPCAALDFFSEKHVAGRRLLQEVQCDVCDHLDQVTKLFVTAYHVAKMELPFTAYQSLVSLQQTNGLELGASYHSHQAARRFISFIYSELRKPMLEAITSSRYICPETFRQCRRDLTAFSNICQEVGVPPAEEKTFSLHTTTFFLGIELDTVAMEARLPPDKLSNCRIPKINKGDFAIAEVPEEVRIKKLTLRCDESIRVWHKRASRKSSRLSHHMTNILYDIGGRNQVPIDALQGPQLTRLLRDRNETVPRAVSERKAKLKRLLGEEAMWHRRLQGYATGTYKFGRGEKPRTGSPWDKLVKKIETCPISDTKYQT
ncbi:Orexin receptor type 2 [Branchiostoma belcheri]|nr:Orexin receptor type 2 [Branchiostoma belcheri]